ncbi:MAG TPA: ACT domain-containing protein, partial [Pseudobacillus sp.]
METNVTANPLIQEKGRRNRGRLLVKCPDRPGIVAAISKFLSEFQANIVESSQYSSDPEGGTFFIRIEFDCPNLAEKKNTMEADFKGLANTFTMEYQFTYTEDRKRTAIFVSK